MEKLLVDSVRGLKGAPLSVLVVLMLVRQPVGAEYLARMTGYTFKPVNQALLLLKDFGLVAQINRYTWQIGDASQLMLSWNNSTSDLITTTTTIEESEAMGVVVVPGELEKFQVERLLNENGIKGKTAKRLAGMAHMTESYARAHLTQLGKIDLALLIYKMQCGDPAPAGPEDENKKYISGELGRFVQY